MKRERLVSESTITNFHGRFDRGDAIFFPTVGSAIVTTYFGSLLLMYTNALGFPTLYTGLNVSLNAVTTADAYCTMNALAKFANFPSKEATKIARVITVES